VNEKYNWIDKLDENNLKYLINYKYEDYPINDDLKNDVLNRIKTYRLKNTKNSFRLSNFFTEKRFFKFSFSFAVFIGIAVISFIFLFHQFYPEQILCSVRDIKGDAYKMKDDRKSFIVPGEILKEKNEISTGQNSWLDVMIGTGSYITVNENTRIKFERLYKNKDLKKTEIYLVEGSIKVDPEKIYGNSSFAINTDIVSTSVRGTSFTVSVDKNKNSSIRVKEGKVLVKLNYGKDLVAKINGKDKELYGRLSAVIEKEIPVEKGESLYADYSKVSDARKTLHSLIDEFDDMKVDDKNSDEIENKLEEISDLTGNLTVSGPDTDDFHDESIENEKSIKEHEGKEFELVGNLGINLNEKNTVISDDGKKIFIVNGSDLTVSSIDPGKAGILWRFKDKDLTRLTGPISVYHDVLIIPSQNFIYILDDKGNALSKQSIDGGPVNWAESVIINDRLYIPGAGSVFVYDGKSLKHLPDVPVNAGQIYVSKYPQGLVLAYSDEMILRLYDLSENKVVWNSVKLEQNVFMPAFYKKDTAYIADIGGNFYEFSTNYSSYMNLRMPSGTCSNIIYSNSSMFMVANDGYLYKIYGSMSLSKIEKVDNFPEMNKYMTKKLMEYDDVVYFCSDNGSMYYFDAKNDIGGFKTTGKNAKNPLIGKPSVIGSKIYVLDIKSNVYSIPIEVF
jgi:hypothetical protein